MLTADSWLAWLAHINAAAAYFECKSIAHKYTYKSRNIFYIFIRIYIGKGQRLNFTYAKFKPLQGVQAPGDSKMTVGQGISVVGTPLQNFAKFVYPTLPVSFGLDTKSRRSLLSGVHARGSKISHTGVNV